MLPEAPVPIGNYVTSKKIGDLIYTSGHIPITAEFKNDYIGKVGKDITTEKAYEASKLVCDLTISTIINMGIDINLLTPINVIGYVNAIDSFEEHPKVLNGFTDQLIEYIQESTVPTRSAVGVSSLPNNVCVEIQSIFKINKSNESC